MATQGISATYQMDALFKSGTVVLTSWLKRQFATTLQSEYLKLPIVRRHSGGTWISANMRQCWRLRRCTLLALTSSKTRLKVQWVVRIQNRHGVITTSHFSGTHSGIHQSSTPAHFPTSKLRNTPSGCCLSFEPVMYTRRKPRL